MNLDMCFLVDAADVIMCCTILLGPGSPSLFRIWIKTTPLQPESSLKKRLCITIIVNARENTRPLGLNKMKKTNMPPTARAVKNSNIKWTIHDMGPCKQRYIHHQGDMNYHIYERLKYFTSTRNLVDWPQQVSLSLIFISKILHNIISRWITINVCISSFRVKRLPHKTSIGCHNGWGMEVTN